MVSISEITGMEGDVITMQEVFRYQRTGLGQDNRIVGHFTATGIRSHFSERFRMWGYPLPAEISSVGAVSVDPQLAIYGAILLAVPLLLGGVVLVAFGAAGSRRTAARRAVSPAWRAAHAKAVHVDSLRKEAGGRSDGPGLVEIVERRLRRRAAGSRWSADAAPRPAALVGAGRVSRASPSRPRRDWACAWWSRRPSGPWASTCGCPSASRARLSAIEETLPDAVGAHGPLPAGRAPVQLRRSDRRAPRSRGRSGEEMAVVADEMSYGRDVGEALTEMAERAGLQDLRFLAVAVTIQRQSGGNLAEVLDGLANVIRARFRLFRRVKAITSEAKFSGFFLSGFTDLRDGSGSTSSSPTTTTRSADTAYFMPAVAIVAVLLVANILVMRRLVDIKV